MPLTDENIREFQNIYKHHFGIGLPREVAIEKGMKVLRMMQLVYKPMTRAEYEAVELHMERSGNKR